MCVHEFIYQFLCPISLSLYISITSFRSFSLAETAKTMRSYLELIRQRASGELATPAQWMRNIVTSHPGKTSYIYIHTYIYVSSYSYIYFITGDTSIFLVGGAGHACAMDAQYRHLTPR